jgi:c-di-GMP phosphodiesterase
LRSAADMIATILSKEREKASGKTALLKRPDGSADDRGEIVFPGSETHGGSGLGSVPMKGAARRAPLAAARKPEAGLRYVARQPILDEFGRAHGYELLFRSAPTGGFKGDGEQATRTMLDNLLLFDLQGLTGGAAAFVNCTAEAVLSGLVEISSPETTVLELLETVEATPDLVRSCRALKAQGYRLALDDFEWHPGVEPLVEMSDFIKVDFLQYDAAGRQQLLEALQGYRARLIAEKLETQSDYEQAKLQGFKLFQGYYFYRPELVTYRVVPSNLVVHIRMLQELQREEMDFPEMARLVKSDPAVAYRLLRMVNSAAFGMRREIRSVEMALIGVGRSLFRNLVMVAIMEEFCPPHAREVLRMALVRSRFCELSAEEVGYDPAEQHLIGLLSLLPAMLQVRMDKALADIGLREEVRHVLLGDASEEAVLLLWIENYERGEWEECDRIAGSRNLDRKQLVENLRDALYWADAMLMPVN